MATTELAKLASAVERQTVVDDAYDTAVPALKLSRFSAPSALVALVYEPYQKRLRLQEARRPMLGEGLDAAEAAFRVGYESPSQFNREYRRTFGDPPRQDVVALKGEAQPTA